METLKKLKNPILWFLSAVFLTWGWQLLGTAYLVIFIVTLLVLLLFMAESSNTCEVDDFVYFCLTAGVAAVASAMVETLAGGFIVLIFLCILVWFFCSKDEKGVIQVAGSFALFICCLFAQLVWPPVYLTDKEVYDEWHAELVKAKIPQEMKEKIEANPLILKRENNFIKNEIKRLDSLTQINQDSTMTVINRMRKIKASEVNEELAKFDGKTKILKIERMWLTSDVLPWTYSMWKTIEYNLSLKGHFSGHGGGMFSRRISGSFNASGKVTPDMSGESNYVGNNELSYINILFSDNSYQRFSIADDPKWLLAKEGERVRMEYHVSYVDERRISLEDLVKPCGSLSKTYVPLFK